MSRYLHRFDKELREIEETNNIKGRQGRTHASRELALKTIIERERELYHSFGLGMLSCIVLVDHGWFLKYVLRAVNKTNSSYYSCIKGSTKIIITM